MRQEADHEGAGAVGEPHRVRRGAALVDGRGEWIQRERPREAADVLDLGQASVEGVECGAEHLLGRPEGRCGKQASAAGQPQRHACADAGGHHDGANGPGEHGCNRHLWAGLSAGGEPAY